MVDYQDQLLRIVIVQRFSEKRLQYTAVFRRNYLLACHHKLLGKIITNCRSFSILCMSAKKKENDDEDSIDVRRQSTTGIDSNLKNYFDITL